MQVSLFASAIRPHLWDSFLNSLLSNTIEYEVVFSGPCTKEEVEPFLKKYPEFKYIHTSRIKPSQCYEIARRECRGELIGWTADDCEYSEQLLDKVYALWRNAEDKSFIISVKTNENKQNNDLNRHRFFADNYNTPLMAPLGFMSRFWLDNLGGLDRRYINGQYENDIVMRILSQHGSVIKFEDGCVTIDHLAKHGPDTLFWKDYDHDRKILENSWVVGGYQKHADPIAKYTPAKMPPIEYIWIPENREVTLIRNDKFEPFDATAPDFLTKSQSYGGIFE